MYDMVKVVIWLSGSMLILTKVDAVAQHRARLVLGWVTIAGLNSATQVNSAWPSLCGRQNEYQLCGKFILVFT